MNKNLLMLFLLGLVLTACAEAAPPQVDQAISDWCKDPYGFWGGLWHGMTAFFQCMGSLLDDDITFYAKCNNGGWYDLGYCIGVGAFFGGGSSAAGRR